MEKMEGRVRKLEDEVAELQSVLFALIAEDEDGEEEGLDPIEGQHQEFAAHIKAVRGL